MFDCDLMPRRRRLGSDSLHAACNCVEVELIMRHAVHVVLALNAFVALFSFSGCESVPAGIQQARISQAQQLAAEPPGDYFIGRRYYKPEFKFWGYVRRPGQPWSMAKLVMLNEKEKLAPDREQLSFGKDNNYEYKLFGYFSGETVYEPASNGFYPEFVLKNYQLISVNPPPIFKSQMSGRDQAATPHLLIEKPVPF